MNENHDENSKQTVTERRTEWDYNDALNKSLEMFVSYEGEFDDVMSNALIPISEVADIDRILFFRVWDKECHYAGEVYRWDKIMGGTAPVDDALKVLPVFGAMKRWISVMNTDACVSIRRSDFEEDEAAFLSPRGVMSILIVPVFVQSDLWGVVTFHDNKNERDFSGDCTAMLRSAARLCAQTIIREQKNQAVEYRGKMMEALNKTSVTLLSQRIDSFEDMMTAGVLPIADMARIDRIVLYRNQNLTKGLHMSQVYRWDRNSGGSTKILSEYSSIPYSNLMPEWEQYLENGNFVNTPVKELSPPEATMLEQFGIKSVAALPIFINNIFWGFAIFGDTKKERKFSDEIVDMFRSAAFLYANAFIQTDMERETSEKNEILHIINYVSFILLESHIDNFLIDLTLSMKIVASAVNADRIYIYKNFVRDGNRCCSLIYECEGNSESPKDFAPGAEIPYSNFPEWSEKLSKGNCINGIASEISDREKTVFNREVMSVLITPIFISNRFWGFIGVDDCKKERLFTNKEETILRSASQIIASALIRNEEAENAHEAEERIMLMLDASPFGCQIIDHNLITVDCNKAIVELFGFKSKQEFLDKWLNECSPKHQPDGRSSDEAMLEYRKKAIKEGACSFEWLHQLPDGTPMPTEVSLVRVEYKNTFVLVRYTRDLSEIKQMEENISYLETEVEKIYIDPLTGIYNRRFLDENIERLTKTLSRSNSMLSFLMIDIDKFKKYNDSYGHDEGDKCLQTIAKTLAKSLHRTDDFSARYGGEEFAVVLPNTGEHGARMIAEKLLKNVRSCNIPHESCGVASHVTISIGVTTGTADNSKNHTDFIKRADEMLYKSKNEGRNRYSFTRLL
jgi:diguanylate cyclase (GGDEF)-like protein/PAS domain S-box-containing protein